MEGSCNPGRRGEVRFERRRILIICDDGERCFDLGKLQSLKFEIVCVNIPVTLKESSGEIYYKDFKKLSLDDDDDEQARENLSC